MFSTRLIKLIAFASYVASTLGAIPLRLDRIQIRFICNSSHQRTVNRNFCVLLFWLLSAIPIIYIRYQIGDRNKLNLSMGYFFVVFLMVCAYSICYFHAREACRVLNGLFSLVRHVQANYMPDFNPNKSKLNWILEAIILFTAFNYVGLYLQLFLFVSYDPQSTIHIGKLIPNQYFYLPVRLAVTIFHQYIYLILSLNCGMIVCACAIYGFYVTILLTQELKLGRKSYITLESMRKVDNLQLMYRSFQVLHENVFCFLGLYLVSMDSVFMVASIYLNFILMRYWEELEVSTVALLSMTTCLTMAVWTAVLELGKIFFIKGRKVLVSWKRKDWGSRYENRIMKQFRLGSKPILISYGKQFIITRVSILVYYRGIVRGTFRTVIMMG